MIKSEHKEKCVWKKNRKEIRAFKTYGTTAGSLTYTQLESQKEKIENGEEEIMAEKFQELMINTKLQIQEI